MPSQLFPYTLTFRGGHGQHTFTSHIELADWVAREWDRYYPMATASSTRPEPLPDIKNSFSTLASAKGLALDFKGLEPDPASQEFANKFYALRDQLAYFYGTKGVPPSDSSAIYALLPIAMGYPHAALAALAWLCDPSKQMP
jgi:hypothetical protein